MEGSGPIDARRLTDDADWAQIALWSHGTLGEDGDGRFVQTSAGKVRAGLWIVATPGGQFSHAVYSDRDYRGFLALLGRSGERGASDSRREVVYGRVEAAMRRVGAPVEDAVLLELAEAAVAEFMRG